MTQQTQGTINVTEGGGIEYGETNMMNGAFGGVASGNVANMAATNLADVKAGTSSGVVTKVPKGSEAMDAGLPRAVASTTTTTMPMTPSAVPPAPHEVIRGPEILKQQMASGAQGVDVVEKSVENSGQNSVVPKTAKPSIMELANNDVFSVATIEKEARRIKRKEDGEVFVSLH